MLSFLVLSLLGVFSCILFLYLGSAPCALIMKCFTLKKIIENIVCVREREREKHKGKEGTSWSKRTMVDTRQTAKTDS
jgi:hypothetical protein